MPKLSVKISAVKTDRKGKTRGKRILLILCSSESSNPTEERFPISGNDNNRQQRISSPDSSFSGRSYPALLSLKEPAIRMLKERYSETFALTRGSNQNQIHLFIIKSGMWALVWTFTSRDFSDSSHASKGFGLDGVLTLIEEVVSGKNGAMLEKIDRSVRNALDRIKAKTEEFKRPDSTTHHF